MSISRRRLITGSAALLTAAATKGVAAAGGNASIADDSEVRSASGSKPFLFAVVSDSHVIDKFYKPGSENSPEDNDSILHANERLVAARDTINNIRLADGRRVEHVFMPGDLFHNYPSPDYEFYQKNITRIDNFKQIAGGFAAPVHLGFGNHDYGVPQVSREMSHRLFKEKLGAEPYSSVDLKGFRFLHLNNFLGSTWDSKSPSYNQGLGSLGETQLQWAEDQLQGGKPTVVFVHYPLWSVLPTEIRDFGLHPLLRKYQSNVQIVLSGHVHKWIDFAHTYGPQHTVCAATRYDPKSWMLWEANPTTGQVRWLDANRVLWSTHFSRAYQGAT